MTSSYKCVIAFLVIAAGVSNFSVGYVVSSPFDDVDKCIYTCDYCFKGKILVKCANECLEGSGKMSPLWITACPEFNMPLFFQISLDNPDTDIVNDGNNNNIN